MQSFCRSVDGWSHRLGGSASFCSALHFLPRAPFSAASHPALGFCSCFASCKARLEEACSRWHSQFWVIALLPRSEGWPFRRMELRLSALLLLVQRWGAGSQTTSPGAGFSTSTSPSAFLHSYWSISWSKIHRT